MSIYEEVAIYASSTELDFSDHAKQKSRLYESEALYGLSAV